MELIQKQTFKHILKNENIQIALIGLIMFLVPFFIKQPQLVVGSAINFLLIFAISRYDFKKIIPILFLPSMASFLNGLLFGKFTVYLLYFIPFIVFSNAVYVLVFKYIRYKYLNVAIAALIKACLLFSVAYILFNTIHIPEIFLTTMGLIQLYTALIGGIFASFLINSKRK